MNSIDKNDFSVTVAINKINFDLLIHGTPGEDGLMQAYLELLEIPQTSCDYYQAALTFNKRDLCETPTGLKRYLITISIKGDSIQTEIVNK
jgi:D-alanine-D-alanine ligase